jgi:hypothetical protein
MSSTASASARNLTASNLTVNWTDEDSPNGQTQAMTGTVYANVYAPAGIAITPTAPIASAGTAATIPFTATLTGGYGITAQTISISPDAAATSAGITSGGSCAVSSATPNCTLNVSTATTTQAGSYNLTVTNGGDVSITTPHSITLVAGKMIFVTSGKWNGDLKSAGNGSDGFDGANKLCTQAAAAGSKTSGLGSSWKALLLNNNATITNMVYVTSLGELITSGATGGNLVGFTQPLMNSIRADENGNVGSSSDVWTGFTPDLNAGYTGWTSFTNGAAANSCSEWTDSNSGSGVVGASWLRGGATTSTDPGLNNAWNVYLPQGCSAAFQLYCVQQ